jgi:predicted ATPase
MRFANLELRNWRNFVKVSMPMVRRAFIVGPNAIGKSNLLDAIRFLRDLVIEGRLERAVELRGGMAAVRSLHAKAVSDVQVGVDVIDDDGVGWRYELVFNRENSKSTRPTVVRESVWRLASDADPRVVLQRPDAKDRADTHLLRQTALEQTSANQKFRELAEFLQTVTYVHLVPQLVREEQPPSSARAGIDPFGRDLLERIRATPPRFQRGRLSRIQKVLRIVAPQLEELAFELDGRGRPHLTAKFQHWRARGAFQRETQFSDGTLRLIGLLWTMQEKAGPLLLEEPELSLHSGIVSRLAPFIHRAQMAADGRQVILSTHAEQLLADPGISPEEVFLVQPAQEGSEVIPGAHNARIQRLMSHGILASEAVMPMSATPQLELFDKAQP